MPSYSATCLIQPQSASGGKYYAVVLAGSNSFGIYGSCVKRGLRIQPFDSEADAQAKIRIKRREGYDDEQSSSLQIPRMQIADALRDKVIQRFGLAPDTAVRLELNALEVGVGATGATKPARKPKLSRRDVNVWINA